MVTLRGHFHIIYVWHCHVFGFIIWPKIGLIYLKVLHSSRFKDDEISNLLASWIIPGYQSQLYTTASPSLVCQSVNNSFAICWISMFRRSSSASSSFSLSTSSSLLLSSPASSSSLSWKVVTNVPALFSLLHLNR